MDLQKDFKGTRILVFRAKVKKRTHTQTHTRSPPLANEKQQQPLSMKNSCAESLPAGI